LAQRTEHAIEMRLCTRAETPAWMARNKLHVAQTEAVLNHR